VPRGGLLDRGGVPREPGARSAACPRWSRGERRTGCHRRTVRPGARRRSRPRASPSRTGSRRGGRPQPHSRRSLQLAEVRVHSARLVHRDIHPGNILVDPRTLCVHLIDFGLAQALGAASPRSDAHTGWDGIVGHPLGSPRTTPEQNHPHHEGLAEERRAQLLLELHRDIEAKASLSRAAHVYEAWGAAAADARLRHSRSRASDRVSAGSS
jgi:aminoglycoside phosphotransferase (APT) family kinase protein